MTAYEWFNDIDTHTCFGNQQKVVRPLKPTLSIAGKNTNNILTGKGVLISRRYGGMSICTFTDRKSIVGPYITCEDEDFKLICDE